VTADCPRSVHQPKLLSSAWRVIGQPSQRGLHQQRGGLDPVVVLALAQQAGEQVPYSCGRGTQPVPLVVIAQQYLRRRQAHQLRVAHLGRPARAGTTRALQGDDAVGQLDVECDQKSVQVGDHDGSQGQTCADTPILDTLRFLVTDHRPRVAARRLSSAELPVIDLGAAAVGLPYGIIEN
jgi:hypothetical protein